MVSLSASASTIASSASPPGVAVVGSTKGSAGVPAVVPGLGRLLAVRDFPNGVKSSPKRRRHRALHRQIKTFERSTGRKQARCSLPFLLFVAHQRNRYWRNPKRDSEIPREIGALDMSSLDSNEVRSMFFDSRKISQSVYRNPTTSNENSPAALICVPNEPLKLFECG